MYSISKRWCGLVGLASILSRAAAQSNGIREITTTTAGGWRQDGVMFDVEVVKGGESSAVLNSTVDMPDGITIVGMDILTPSEETVCVEIYSKSGSLEGFETDPAAWTFLGSVSVVGNGKDTLTSIPIRSFDSVFLPMGERSSFYVTTQDQNMRYTAYPDGEHTTGSVFTSQTVSLGTTSAERSAASELIVNIYTGVATVYKFGATWPDRMFNGNLQYTLGSDISNVPVDAAAKAASRGKVTCDSTVAPTATPTISKAPTDAPTTTESTLEALATILAGGLLQSGNMFDVSVPSVEEGGPEEGVTVLGMEISTTSTDNICVEVYSKDGTFVGFEENPSEWTMLGAVTATGQGPTLGTRLSVGSFDPVHIGPGGRIGFYVAMPDPVMRYTKPLQGELVGDVFRSNADLQIHVGSANGFDFVGYESGRIWNGAIIYAQGVQADGKYGEVTADDRPRSCSVPGAEAIAGDDTATDAGNDTEPNSDGITDAGDTTTNVDTTTPDAGDTDAAAGSPDNTTDTDVATGSPDNTTDTDATPGDVAPGTDAAVSDETAASLSGYCDAAGANSTGVSKEVVLNYKYTVITGNGDSANGVVSSLEEEIYDVMMIDKCAVGNTTARRKLRRLQRLQEVETVSFIGFKSAPEDVVTSESCPSGTTVPEGDVCSVVQGGVTAVVSNDANEAKVKQSMSTLVQQVLSNDAIAKDVGAVDIYYISSDEQEGTEDQSPAIEEDLSVAKAQGSNNAVDDAPLSTTQIIIIAAVCGGVLLVALLGIVLVRRKRSKRADEKALFNEFPNEEGYGDIQNLAFRKSDDPLDNAPTHSQSWGSSEGIETAKYAWSDAALILNEQDEISIISNDRSKYAPSALFPPSSGNSVSSKKNVEFIKAGRSFASRSSQPEDTVDL